MRLSPHLRQHYRKGGGKWIPKKGYSNLEDIEKELGFVPTSPYIYRCDVCDKLHVGHVRVNESNG